MNVKNVKGIKAKMLVLIDFKPFSSFFFPLYIQ